MMRLNPLQYLKKMKYHHWMGVVMVLIIYAFWKAYVLSTPSPHDDQIPDKVKDAILLMVYDPDSDEKGEFYTDEDYRG